MQNMYKRLARLEAIVNAQKSEMMEILQDGYKRAVEAADEENAATAARKIRNRLLAECDWTQTTDAPANKQLWATYRQALRDIPEQPSFPLAVVFPVAPEN